MRLRPSSRVPAVALGFLLAAPGAGISQQTVRIDGPDRALAGEPETLWSVGVAEGADYEMFSDVSDVAFDAAGNLYVADRDNGRIQVFGPDGAFLRQIGKKGQGPGELGQPLGVTVTSDGTVVVSDLGRGAFSLFDSDGTFQRNVLFGPELGPFVRQMMSHSEGGVVAPASRMRGFGTPGAAPEMSDKQGILHHSLAEGAKPSLMFEAESPPMRVRTSGSAGNQNVMVSPPPTFSPDVDWAVLPGGGLAVSSGTDYAVSIVGPSGAVSHVLTRPIAARPVSEADKNAARERQREAMESGRGMIRVEANNGARSTSTGGSANEAMIQQALARMEFAETMPAIQTLTTTPGGRIWVVRTPSEGIEGGPIDILGADGSYRGTLPAGTEVPVAFARDGRAAYIERDEWGVAQVVVRRLPTAWR